MARISDEARGPTPELGGKDDLLLVERASATPLKSRLEPTTDSTGGLAHEAFAGEPVRGPLDGLLEWFTSVVTHPTSAADGVETSTAAMTALGAKTLEDLVTRGPRLSAVDRLGLYHYAYHARLVECLADDYPGVKHALGDARFETLARGYIEAHPSRSPNLNSYGRGFADYARTQGAWLPEHDFVADLARLEWAMVEVVHARPSPSLSMALLEQLPPEAWPELKLVPAPALRFIEAEFPVNRYLQAVRRDQSPELPARGWSGTAIYRKDFVIWRMDFTPPMAGVLKAILAGQPLGAALETLPIHEDERLASDVMVWFREWVSGSFFERIERPGRSES